MKKMPGRRFRLVGHTDEAGDENYNQALSERRAVAVREYLIANRGVEPHRIETEGHGKREPLYPGEHTLSVELDVQNEVREGNKQDNTASLRLYVNGDAIADASAMNDGLAPGDANLDTDAVLGSSDAASLLDAAIPAPLSTEIGTAVLVTVYFGYNGFVLDMAKTKTEGKLVRVYEKDGHTFGVLELALEFAIDKIEKVAFEKPAVMKAKMVLDTAIDGSTTAGVLTADMTLEGTAEVERGGQKFTMQLTITAHGEKHQSAQK